MYSAGKKPTINQKVRKAYDNVTGTPKERQARKMARIERKDLAKSSRQEKRIERKANRKLTKYDVQAAKAQMQGYGSVAEKRRATAENIATVRGAKVPNPRRVTNVNVSVQKSGNKKMSQSQNQDQKQMQKQKQYKPAADKSLFPKDTIEKKYKKVYYPK